MKKKLSNSQTVTYWLAWTALSSFFIWASVKSIFGIISLMK